MQLSFYGMFQQFCGILLLIYLIRQYSFLLIFINANLLIESQMSHFFEFLSIMICYVLFDVTFCRKAELTNVSHERPLSFMNRRNMSVQITSTLFGLYYKTKRTRVFFSKYMQQIATIGNNIDHFHVLRLFSVILYQKKGGN